MKIRNGRPLLGSILAVSVVCFTTVSAASEPAQLPVIASTAIDVDITALPASEKAALAHILHAGRLMDALYIRQAWPGTERLIKERENSQSPASQAELATLNFYKRPWNADGEPFIAGVPLQRPIGDFYPADSSKAEIDSWLKSLGPPERARALDHFTAIRRARSGSFEAVGYSHYYARELELAARELQAAADLTHEPTLKRYLRTRAKALLDDDYFASDVAFVGLKGPVDVVLGPYETEEDSWFGAKAVFQASIGIVNEAATRDRKSVV